MDSLSINLMTIFRPHKWSTDLSLYHLLGVILTNRRHARYLLLHLWAGIKTHIHAFLSLGSGIIKQAAGSWKFVIQPLDTDTEPFGLQMPAPWHYLTVFFSHLSSASNRQLYRFTKSWGLSPYFFGPSPRHTDRSMVCPLFISHESEYLSPKW